MTNNKQPRNKELTPGQLNAIDLLISGKNDRETAEILGVHRNTVIRWRLYDPLFKATLDYRRQDLFGDALERLRSAMPIAVDYLVDSIQKPYTDWALRAAAILLRPLVHAMVRPRPSARFTVEEDEVGESVPGAEGFHKLEERLKARAKADPDFDDPSIVADLRRLYEEHGEKTTLTDDAVSLDHVIDALLEVRCREALTTNLRDNQSK
jgi:hypothetical protein